MSDSEIEPDRSVRAEFDYENATIRLPLAEYQLSDEEWHVINTANFLAYDACLRSRGFTYLELGPFVHDEDRTYGLWHTERARLHGFRLAGEGSSVDTETDESVVLDPGWQQAFGVCTREIEDVRATFVPPDGRPAAMRISQEACRLAYADPAWQEARQRWWACLASHGLQADRRDGKWGSIQASAPGDPASSEELVRIAVIEAQCNEESGMARELADLEAGYQAVFIRGNEMTLAAEIEADRRCLEAARAYIAAHR